jgi:hypothetical protein
MTTVDRRRSGVSVGRPGGVGGQTGLSTAHYSVSRRGNAGTGRTSPAEPSMRRERFRITPPGRLMHTTPVTEQVASLMCDEEYGPTQAPLGDMLRDSTVTSRREDVGPKKGPHLPAWAGENRAHCVPPRHAPHVPMAIAARSGTLCCLAVLGADAAVTAPRAL